MQRVDNHRYRLAALASKGGKAMDVSVFTQWEYYEKVLGAVALVVVLSMFLERALSLPFEWSPIRDFIEQKKLRAPIAYIVSWIICWRMQFDLLPLMSNQASTWNGFTVGLFLTAAVIAGG